MLLSIIIVEYYSLNDIENSLLSIQEKVNNINTEIIISSNSTYTKQEQIEIKKSLPKCLWIFNSRNGGFAYAMNRGLQIARGDYLIIMNPDCIINYGIKEMALFLRANPSIGAIGPQIIDNKGNIQDSCRDYVSLPSFLFRQIKRLITRKESILHTSFDYTKIQTVDWIIGAFIMVSRKAYELTNGMSEDYFMYAEDLDWCTRIRKAGLEIVYYPKAIIEYKGTRSARKTKKYAKIFLNSHFTYWKKFGFCSGYPLRTKITFEK